MTEVETEFDSRYDDVDVESILARCQRQGPLFSRKRSIYQAPEFIKRLPATHEVEEGSTVSFACKVVGFPNPTVTWYKDDDVISQDARAKIETEDSGIHSINIAVVSKCDAGIYKIRASNLEGSSKSMLYISVTAKRRKRKKAKRSGMVACAPLFPAIIERVAEEQKAMLEVELQPESPLTPLYCTISRKAPVMWPAFLGDWAYNADDMLNKDEIEYIDAECVEDVFDSDSGELTTEDVTFVSSAFAQVYESPELSKPDNAFKIEYRTSNSDIVDEDKLDTEDDICDTTAIANYKSVLQSDNVCNVVNPYDDGDDDDDDDGDDDDGGDSKLIRDDSATNEYHNDTDECNNNTVCDILNNNGKITDPGHDHSEMAVADRPRDVSSKETEHKQMYCDPDTVASIAVHRSYARGDSTSSVARRSPSPFSRSRNHITFTHNGLQLYGDATTLQNMNNERILHRMNQQNTVYHRCLCYFRSMAISSTWEDHLGEVILLLCGSTFFALCFDLTATTFSVLILVAMFIKLVITYVFKENL